MSPFWWFPIASIILNLGNAIGCVALFGNWPAAAYWCGAAWMTLWATIALEWFNR